MLEHKTTLQIRLIKRDLLDVYDRKELFTIGQYIKSYDVAEYKFILSAYDITAEELSYILGEIRNPPKE